MPVNVKDEDTLKASEELYSRLKDEGMKVILDDRDERAGVKFKDADLLGMPMRVTISSKTLKEGSVEVKPRTSEEASFVKLEDAPAELKRLIFGQ